MNTFTRKLLSLLGILGYIQYKKKSSQIPKDCHVLIHIGKCGGQTVRDGFLHYNNDVDMQIVHVTTPIYRKDLNYFIVARGPISRLSSAFRWRYKLVIKDGTQSDRFKGEKEVLLRYKTLNNLAEDLYHKDGTPNFIAHQSIRKIHHINESISFYLKELLNKCNPSQITGVLMQENLNNDIYRLFGYKNELNTHSNPKLNDESELSDLAIKNLKLFFYDDYALLTKLYCWSKIAPDVYSKAISNY